MITAWAVLFRPIDRPRHVLAYGCDGGAWVVVDSRLRRTEVRALAGDAFDAWQRETLGAEPCDVWRLDVQAATSVLTPGLWCVGTVKRLLGLRSGAFTPAGLRRDMRKASAVQIWNGRQSDTGRPGRESRERG